MLVVIKGLFIVVTPIIIVLFLLMVVINPKIAIYSMPVVAFFTTYDPLGIGFSPEKILMAIVFLFWIVKKNPKKTNELKNFRPLLIAFSIFVVISAIGLFIPTASFAAGVLSIQSLVLKGLFVIVSVSLLSDIEDLKKCFSSMSALILIAFGSMIILVFQTKDILFFRTEFQTLPGIFPSTVFRNPNIASFYGVVLYPIMFSLGMQKIQFWKKLIYFFLCALTLCGILLTFSRSGLVEMVFINLYLIWKFRIKLTTLFFIIFFSASIYLLFTHLPYFSLNVTRTLAGQDASTKVRIYLLKASIKTFQTNPIFGSGPGSFQKEIFPYYNQYDTSNYLSVASHNDWTNLLVESGVVGLSAFAILIIILLKVIISIGQLIPHEDQLWYFLTGLTGSLIGAGLDSFTHEVLNYNLLWYIIALSLVVVKVKNRSNEVLVYGK